jgi:exosortase A-associated hydrolase 1
VSGTEIPLSFECDAEVLVGILHLPTVEVSTGVLIIVGGPQYRIGSHRQYVLLARHLAAGGLAVLRFDHRGMGDSSGEARDFEGIETDIRRGIDELLQRCPTVRRVILFGLCDAASAALIYAQSDRRVAGVALLNPWIRNADTLAKTYLKHYYLQRFVQHEFWTKLISGKLSLRRSWCDLLENFRQARGIANRTEGAPARVSFQQRMLEGLWNLRAPILLAISGRDLTAAEFLGAVNASAEWARAVRAAKLTRYDLPDADHTCSRRVWRDDLAAEILRWIRSI